MTTLQLYETIQQIFPDVKQAQILLDIDTSQKKFASDTGILTAVGALATISSNFAWTLPSDFKRLNDVTWYDSSNKPVYEGEDSFLIRHEIEFNKFFVYSTTSTPITSVPTAASTGYIHYEQIPTTIASTATALEIPLEYRDALEHDILSKYFAKYPIPAGTDREGNIFKTLNLRAAQWHQAEYDKIRIQAKRDFYSRDKTGEVMTYDHAGRFALPRRARDTSQGTTATNQVTALTAVYTKYIAYTVTSPSTVTETISQIGYSTVSGSVATNTFTVTSTAEFGVDTQILCNNGLVSYVYNSSSQITFTFPAGWGTIAIEIYERV